MSDRPDPGADYWNSTDVANWLGLKISTISAYRARGQMPAPDLTVGARTHLWKPRTIIEWDIDRPSRQEQDPDA